MRDNADGERSPVALVSRILEIAGPRPDSRRLMRAALDELRACTGCEAAAIRLQEDDDYPYVAEQGFPATFLNAGNSLVKRRPDGTVVLDESGKPVLECACGAVIRRAIPAGHPGFTPGGSWWTGTAGAAASGHAPPSGDAPWDPHCPDGGYKSIACVPLVAHGEVYGVVQLNSRREHALTAEVVSLLEPAVNLFARVLSEQLENEKLRACDAVHTALFDTMSEAFAYFRVRYETDGTVRDWVYLTVNEAFLDMLGVSDPTGKEFGQVMPGWRESWPDLATAGQRVVATGKPERLETYSEQLGKWLAFRLSSPARDHVLIVLEDISARKEVEDRLRRLEFSLDNMVDYPIWIDSEGRIVEVSEATCRRLEYTREELLSMSLWDIDPAVDREILRGFRERWKNRGDTDGFYLVEAQHRTKSGRQFPVEVAVNHVTFAGQDYDCDFCRDVSQRRQSEERLRRMEFALDRMSDYLIWVDSQARIVEVSDTTCRHLEYSREELLGMSVYELDPALTPERFARHWALVTEKGHRTIEAQHRAKSGRLFPVEIAVNHVSFGGEDYDCDFCRDITDRKQADRALRLMQVSLNQAPTMILWLDSNGRIEHANEAGCLLGHRSLEEMRDLHIWDLDPAMTPEAWPERWQMIKKEAPFRYINPIVNRSGQEAVFEVVSHPVEFEGSEYSVDFISNITEQRRAAEQLRRAQFSLDNIGDYPLWIGGDGRIFEVSESTCRHLEYSREELLSMHIWDVDVTTSPEQWPLHWKRSRERGSQVLETRHRTKAGRIIPVEIAAAQVSFGGEEYACSFCRDISERKRLQEDLYLAQLSVDQAPDMVTWLEASGRFIYANESMCRFTGYSREELQAMYVWDLDPTVPMEEFAERWGRADVTAVLEEGVCLCKDGRLRKVELSSSKVTFAGKEVGVTFLRDIDERKRAEQVLRESEERYRQLFELESDAIVLVDDETGQILDANSAAADLYGYTRSELVKMNSTDLATEPEPDRDLPATQGLIASLRRNKKRDGTVFPAEVRHAYFELNGRPVRVAAVRDVTERAKAEQEVLESRQMLQTVLDTVPMRIEWRDRERRYMGCNIAVALDADLPDVTHVIGKTDAELPGLAAPLNARHDDAEVIGSGLPKLQYEEVLEEPSGEQRIIRSSKVPLRNTAGEIIGVLGVHEDITERRKTLDALREREEQLRQSQKMEAVGRLAGGIAHDFNNVLTTIIGYSDLLLGSEAAEVETLRADLTEIRSAAERASTLTRGILAFSRRQTLQPRVLSLNTIISETERLLARTIGADIELRVVSDENLGLVEVDEHQFVQVLLNLAVNARDAMPEGGTLTIATANVFLDDEFCRTHPDASPGRYVKVSVTDTGVGMDAETAAHVFEPFYTTKAPGQGTGLGLATVYGVIAQSGGCTSVESTLGEGTTFDIYLPRFDHLFDETGDDAAPGLPSSRPTILVVDDDANFRAVTVRMLEKRGFRVLPVADGDHAMSIIENSDMSVDLLLTDVVLPGSMQGIHIAKRAAALRPTIGLLFMSAYSREAIVNAGRLEEGTDFLEKPFTAEQLAGKVREILASKR